MDLIKVFDLCDNLWESTAVIDRPEEATIVDSDPDSELADIFDNQSTVSVYIKGKPYDFVTDFLPITKDGILNEKYSRAGIYIWKQESSGAYYVGQAVDIQDRTLSHCRAPNRDSKKLHNAIKAHGITDFKVAVIEFCSAAKEELNRLEIEWIEELNTFWDRHDHNLTPGGEGGKGGTLTFEDFKVLVEQLRTTGEDALSFTELGSYWGFKGHDNISDINKGRHAYIKRYAKKLNVTFPIRSTEDKNRTAHDKFKVNNPQYKDWNLVVTYGQLNSAGQYEVTGKEILGRFRGKDDAWVALCEIERTKYGTSKEDMARTKSTFSKGTRGAACFKEIAYRKFARRYTLEPI